MTQLELIKSWFNKYHPEMVSQSGNPPQWLNVTHCNLNYPTGIRRIYFTEDQCIAVDCMNGCDDCVMVAFTPRDRLSYLSFIVYRFSVEKQEWKVLDLDKEATK